MILNRNIIAVLLSISLSFPPMLSFAQSNFGGVMSYCEAELPRTLNPITAVDDIVNIRLTTMMYEGLFAYDIDREIKRRLAADYIVSGTNDAITVRLRRNVRWSDGRTFTARDVRATIDAIRRIGSVQERRIIDDIADVRVLDDYTVEITFKGKLPEDIMLKKLTFKILPNHKLASLEQTSQRERLDDAVSTGYYQLTRMSATDMALQANRHFRERGGGTIGPYIDEIRMFVQVDIGTQIEYLLNQQVDVLVEIPPTAIARLRAAGFQIKPYESLSYHFIAFNFNNSGLHSREVRQAMVYGFNRASALDRIYQNQGMLISGPFPPASAFSIRGPEAEPFPYDPSHAIRLLMQAGYVDRAADGTRINAAGDRLEFTLVAPRYVGDDFSPRVVTQFISDMRRIGIRINLEEMEFERWLMRVKYEQRFDLAFAAVVFDEAGNISPFFHSSNNIPGAENFMSYNNPEVDELLDRVRGTLNPQERINISQQLHSILREDCPLIFLWSLNKNAAANQRIRNFMTRVTPFSFFDYVNEWYIRDDW